MINIGQEGSEKRKNAQKEIAAELTFEQVRYFETFYEEYFFCLIMEYCELGHIRNAHSFSKPREIKN
jgi:hypothetical protein